MATTPRRKATRFSLLLLEDGEVLLSDLSVEYRFTRDTPAGSKLHPLSSYPERFVVRSATAASRGRVKIGTRNIFFDSDDWRDPIIRIPLISVDHARPTRDGSRSRTSDDASTRSTANDDDDDNSVLVVANSMSFLREMGSDHPYIDVQLRGRHVFSPLYSSSLELLDEINTLLHISSQMSRRQRERKLKQLVQERESRIPFDITLLEHGVKESAMMDAAASAVYAMSRTPGRFRITEHNLYFMPIHGESSQAVERVATKSITSIRRLRHGFRDAAVEVGYRESKDGGGENTCETLMVAFETHKFRERAIGILLKVVPKDVELFDRASLEAAVGKWRSGLLSNFEYLMYLNFAAGRSFNDLSQYPVFPWILKDFESDSLDLSKDSSFRDLSLPIGALEPKRLESFKQRYKEMPPPRFFYGTHYSTPAYTINYLIRAAPAAMLRLQNGKFDTPDRLFHSISSTWKGVLSNQGDVKELIPEFYAIDYALGDCSGVVPRKSSPGEFLDNVLGLDLGTRQDGKRVDDVELPAWAGGSSELFVRRNREALESDFVSFRLHRWIDLVFGVKSHSPDAHNVFYTDVALPDSLESERSSRLTDEEISQIETVYLEFGRTPQRLFGHPHPPRYGDDRDIIKEEGSASQHGSKPPSYPPASFARNDLAGSEKAMWSDQSDDPDDSSGESTSLVRGNNEKVDTPLGSRSVWGSRSRRIDSVLQGASEYILSPYEPSADEENHKPRTIPKLRCLQIITPNRHRHDSVIVDMCIVRGDTKEGHASAVAVDEAETPAICTVWSDGYLKVHSERTTLRSKHVGDACSVTYVSPGLVVFGTPVGSIGVYSIDTGRVEVVQSAAHDAEVYAIEYIQKSQTLISGSKDASVKVWRLDRPSHRIASLKLIQELDAECCIEDIGGTVETVQGMDGTEATKRLLVAASTTDGEIMAWEIDLGREEQSFLEPILRSCNSKPFAPELGGRPVRVRKLAWLYQGNTRRPALATVHGEEKCLRVWNLSQSGMAAAEVYISDGGARCVASCDESRTLLVGGLDGQVSEFDSTGLCLGCIISGQNEVRNVLFPEGGDRMYVFAGRNEALRVNR